MRDIQSFILAICWILPLVSCTAFTQTATPEAVEGLGRGRFTARDLFGLQQAADVQISPDGQHVVYVREAEDIMTDSMTSSLWMVDVVSGQQREWVHGAASTPRWSPDGARIAFLAPDERKTQQIYVQDVRGKSKRQITREQESPGSIAWSPDGSAIAFTRFVADEEPTPLAAQLQKPDGAAWAPPLKTITAARYAADGAGYLRTGFTHLFIVPASGGPARQLTYGPSNEHGTPSWSPDGQDLLFGSDRGERDHREMPQEHVWEVRVLDGSLQQLTHRRGPDESPLVSPDGKLIAYAGSDYPDRVADLHNYTMNHLYVMRRDGSHTRPVGADLDRDIGQFRWSADGRGLYVAYDNHGLIRVALLTLDGRTTVIADSLTGTRLDQPETDGSFSISHTGIVAFPLGAPDHPADVAVATLAGGTRRLTSLNADLFKRTTLAAVQPLLVKSSFDGLPVGAWIVTPPDYDPSRRYPTILSIHGGPNGSYGPLWASDYQLYAAAGYVVLFANPRGSTSYGRAFAEKTAQNFPSHDYDDLMSVVDAAVKMGAADPDRLFVTGGSAGGLLTAWIVGKTNRFSAAVAVKPQIDLTSDMLTNDQYFSIRYLFGRYPWQDPMIFWSHSPLSLVGNVETPTMLMVGEEDRRTPPGQAMEFYDALQLRQVPTRLVMVPEAGHESLAERPSQEAAEVEATLTWFNRYGQTRWEPPQASSNPAPR
jgi:dipeptidyl aminopeptidase/acylaminoacyl peptidase